MSEYTSEYRLDYKDMEVLPLKINDENRTPVEAVAKMIQSLDEWTSGKIFTNPDYKFLDINSKSGVFLVLIYNKLMDGLKDVIEDTAKRSEHIITNMLYGISPCFDAALVSRMSLYCNFLNTGNIYQIDGLAGLKGKVLEDRVKGVLKGMKFDVVIGNPPYNRGMDIDFVNLGYELSTKFTCMITPAKWQTAEADQKITSKMSYGQFREKLVPHMSHVVFYPDSFDLFIAAIAEGVSYYLIDKEQTFDKCIVENRCVIQKKLNSTSARSISNEQSLWNYGQKVIDIIGGVTPLDINIDALKEYRVNINKQFSVGGMGYRVQEQDRFGKWVLKNDIIGKGGPVFSPEGNTYALGKVGILTKNSKDISGTARDVFTSNDVNECKSFQSYIETKIVRFLLLVRNAGLSSFGANKTWKYVPAPTVLDANGNRVPGKFDHIYTDEELYKTFNLPQEYIDVIEAVIKERK